MQRVGLVIGGAIALAAFLLPETFQAAGETMPDWLFYVSATVLSAILLIGGPIWLYIWIAAPTWRFHKTRRYQWPMVDVDKVDPSQWLFDIAKEDADNPERHLYITGQIVRGMDLAPATYRPWVMLGFFVTNGGVHEILIGPISGYAHLKGNVLPDPVEDGQGRGRKPRGHSHEMRVKVYIPKDRADDIYKEYANSGQLRSIGLGAVNVQVAADLPGAPTVTWYLGQSDTFYRPD